MKRTLSIFLSVIFVLASVSLAVAAVEVLSAGTVIDRTEKVDFTGPTIVEVGTKVTIDVTALTDLTVDEDIYADTGLSVDGSLYLTGGDSMEAPLWFRQPDGGCSSCGVDDAGTTLSCTDSACPAGMTQ